MGDDVAPRHNKEQFLTSSIGVKAATLYPMVKEAVAYSNALAFFGEELGTYNPKASS